MLNVFKQINIYTLGSLVIALTIFFPVTALASEQTILQGIVWGLVTAVFGTFAGIAGVLLDTSIENYVVGFGQLYNSGGVGLAVNTVWVSVRDFFNITFIFGIVYIGFKMILGSDDSQTKTWLVNLVMAAILVNFSLYATKFVVDVSNSMASEIAISAFGIEKNDGQASELGVSTVFMNNMGAPALFRDATEKNNAPKGWGFVFGGMIMFVVMIFVFGAGALLILIRFAVLLIYMVLSPLMFIGWVFPQLQRYTSEYWSGFLGRAFFAPIYLFLLYISAQIIDDMVRVAEGNNGVIHTTFSGSGQSIIESTEAINGFPAYMIACIFLVASLVVSQKMGAVGGTAVVSAGKRMGNKVRNKAASMTKSTARVAALPVTLPARKASNVLGNKLDAGLTSFQAKERSGVLGKAAGAVSRWNGVDRAVRSTASSLRDNKMGTGRTRDEDLLYKQKTTNRITQKNTIDDAEQAIKGAGTSVADLTNSFKNLSDVMRKMSNDDIMDLGFDKLNDETFAINLKDSHIEHFEKSGKFSSQQIQTIKDTRKKGIMRTVNSGSVANSANPNASDAAFMDTQRQNIFRGNVNDIAKLPTEAFTSPNAYKYITPAMIEAKMKNGVSSTEISDMKNALDIYRSYATTSENKVWDKWKNGNSVHAAKFFS